MHAAMQPPEEGGAGEPPPGLRPHLVAPATWVGPPSHHLRVVGCALGLILLVVTDGSSSSFVGFSLLELVCVFSKYEFLHCAFLVSFALFHVSYLKIAYIPKLVERLDQSPIFYLFLFIKRYLFLYIKRC